jgi:drug/metabolite transporter superfamily protein YnfA
MDHSAVAFVILIFVIVYLAALKLDPALARVVLAAGGALFGIAIFIFLVAGSIIDASRWNAFEWRGPYFAIMPVAILFGSPAGAWVVWRLTRPKKN